MARGTFVRLALGVALVTAAGEARAQDTTGGGAAPSEAPPVTGAAPQPAPAAAAASADGGGAVAATGETKGFMAASHAGVDAYWWSAKVYGSSFGVIPSLSVGVTQNVFIDVAVPLAMNTGSTADKTYAGMGNPTVGVHYGATSGPTTFYAGGATAIPLVKAFDDRDQQTADLTAALAMTYYDVYFWTQYQPIIGILGVEHVVQNKFHLRADLSPYLLIPLRSGTNKDKVELMYQLHLEAEVRGESGFGGGLALQVWHAPTIDTGRNGDNAQGAAEPFFSYDNGALFARVGVLIALDDQLGFGFDRGKVATLHFRIGGYF